MSALYEADFRFVSGSIKGQTKAPIHQAPLF